LGAAATVGIAGCGGGGSTTGGDSEPSTEADGGAESMDDGGSEGPETTSAGADSGSPATCTDLVDEYTSFDPGEHPLTVRGERPSALSNIDYASAPGFNVQMRLPDTDTAPYPKLLRISQSAYRSRGQYEEPLGSADAGEGTSLVEFEFAGETLQAALYIGEETNTLQTRLPYEFDDGKRYVGTSFLCRVFVENGGTEIGPDCPGNVESSLRHMLNALEPNPETTIQSVTDEFSL
jgi:hypothetical protein